MGHTGDMKTNKRTKSKSYGFGLQKDITSEGAILYLRITNSRRLDMKTLGETLLRFLQGGYKTLVLDQGRFARQRIGILEFLGRLQAAYIEGQCLFLERKLK